MKKYVVLTVITPKLGINFVSWETAKLMQLDSPERIDFETTRNVSVIKKMIEEENAFICETDDIDELIKGGEEIVKKYHPYD